MVNMNHAKYENTYKALKECYEALADGRSLDKHIEEANQYEKPYIEKLLKLCRDMYLDFQDEIEL